MKGIKLLWQDLLISLAICSNTLAYFITLYITTSISSLTSSANNVEANPVGRALLNFSYAAFILHLIIYATALAIYLYVRKRRQGQEMLFNFMALLVFLIWFNDLLNDLAVLLRVVGI